METILVIEDNYQIAKNVALAVQDLGKVLTYRQLDLSRAYLNAEIDHSRAIDPMILGESENRDENQLKYEAEMENEMLWSETEPSYDKLISMIKKADIILLDHNLSRKYNGPVLLKSCENKIVVGISDIWNSRFPGPRFHEKEFLGNDAGSRSRLRKIIKDLLKY